MSSGIWYSGKSEEELKQQRCCIKYFITLLEGCSPHGLCVQYHYRWLRLMLEILAALLLPGDWEIWIWVLQLKQLSSGKAEEITQGEGSCEQSSSTAHCNTLQAPASKQLTCSSNQRPVAWLPLTASVLVFSWACSPYCKNPNYPLDFHHPSLWMNITPSKKRDWRSNRYGIPFFCPKISGIFQGFYVVEFMFFSSEI